MVVSKINNTRDGVRFDSAEGGCADTVRKKQPRHNIKSLLKGAGRVSWYEKAHVVAKAFLLLRRWIER